MRKTFASSLLSIRLAAIALLVACSKQPRSSDSGQPAPNAGPTPFQELKYLSFDESKQLAILSPNEVEFSDTRDVTNPSQIFKYTEQDNSLQVLETHSGTTQAVTYKMIDDRLEGSDGSTFFWPPALNSAKLVNFAIEAGKAGKYSEGIIDCGDAIHLSPNFWRAYIERAILYQDLHQYKEAIADCQKVIDERWYGYPAAQNELAWLLATASDASVRNGAKAVELAGAACSAANRADANALDTLAASYAETGQFDLAIKTEQDAIKINADASQADAMQRRLTLYTNRKPFRDSLAR